MLIIKYIFKKTHTQDVENVEKQTKIFNYLLM